LPISPERPASASPRGIAQGECETCFFDFVGSSEAPGLFYDGYFTRKENACPQTGLPYHPFLFGLIRT